MNNCFRFIFFGALFCPLISWAAGTSLLNTGPVPTQSFHQAASSTPATSATQASKKTAVVSEAEEMAKVRAMLKAAKQHAQGNANAFVGRPAHSSLTSSHQSLLNPVTPNRESLVQRSNPSQHQTSTFVTASMNASTVRSLASQISQLNQTSLMFQQQMDHRVEELSIENKNLKEKINKLDQAMVLMSKRLSGVSIEGHLSNIHHDNNKTLGGWSNKVNTATSSASAWLHHVGNDLKNDYKYLVVIFFLVVIMTLLLVPRGNKKAPKAAALSADSSVTTSQMEPTVSAENTDDTEDEYDFMGSKEAIPAQLDLARAYIAMEDVPAAQRVLTRIKQSGSVEQRQEAQDLLKQIS